MCTIILLYVVKVLDANSVWGSASYPFRHFYAVNFIEDEASVEAMSAVAGLR